MRSWCSGARTGGAWFFAWLMVACNPPSDRANPFPGALGGGEQAVTMLSRPVLDIVDTNPDPHVFQADLVVDEQDVVIGGTTVHALVYRDANNPGAYSGTPNGIPVPQIAIDVGDEVIVTLSNELEADCAAMACDTSIHWHGVELDNDSDGTGVTQTHVSPGDTYTYRFIAPRPGNFWFHPHMRPGAQVFAGVYGAFIVRDPNEEALRQSGTIPSEANTHTLVLSDIEFDAEGDVGYVNGDGEAVPWATLKDECATDGSTCSIVADADTVLVNGQRPSGTTPRITAKSGAGVRLRLINTSTNRYFRLSVSENGSDNNLYRIGGEGGLLETVRVEGGTLGSWDTKLLEGELLVPASGRSDVVIVPTGEDGDVITVSGLSFDRGGPSADSPAGDLLFIEIDNSLDDAAFSIAEGDSLQGAGAIEDLKSLTISDFYLDPIPSLPGPGSGSGTSDSTIVMEGLGPGRIAINGVVGHFEDSGPDYTQVPYQGATRYARTGDTLEVTISNPTNQHHPFHHHGFSFQPVAVIDDADDSTLYTFDYPEFIDVIDVPDKHSVVVRMRLDDRPRLTDTRPEAGAPAPDQFFASGGAAGRWVFHCHLFLHAAIGMMPIATAMESIRRRIATTSIHPCPSRWISATTASTTTATAASTWIAITRPRQTPVSINWSSAPPRGAPRSCSTPPVRVMPTWTHSRTRGRRRVSTSTTRPARRPALRFRWGARP